MIEESRRSSPFHCFIDLFKCIFRISSKKKRTMISCENGHYYDGNRHIDCPYCTENYKEDEVRTATMIPCNNGHYYNSTKSSCPYCIDNNLTDSFENSRDKKITIINSNQK